MVIVWGRRLYGRVDRVPGLFFVATQFFHIMYIPLFPLGSYIIGPGRAVPAESTVWRSLLLAWFRVVAGPLAFVLTTVLIDEFYRSTTTEVVAGAAVDALCIASFVVPRFVKPGYERARDLGRQLEFTRDEWALLDRVYGHDDGVVMPRA